MARDGARPPADIYSGISAWTLRDLIASGGRPAVRPPGLRRVWIDRADLDRARRAAPTTVLTPAQVRAVASPSRLEIVEAFGALGRASARELAAHLGRSPRRRLSPPPCRRARRHRPRGGASAGAAAPGGGLCASARAAGGSGGAAGWGPAGGSAGAEGGTAAGDARCRRRVRPGSREADGPLPRPARVRSQHELFPQVSVNVAYFHRWYGNFMSLPVGTSSNPTAVASFALADNLAVTPSDYSPYCVAVPTDLRLPNSEGQLCGLYGPQSKQARTGSTTS